MHEKLVSKQTSGSAHVLFIPGMFPDLTTSLCEFLATNSLDRRSDWNRAFLLVTLDPLTTDMNHIELNYPLVGPATSISLRRINSEVNLSLLFEESDSSISTLAVMGINEIGVATKSAISGYTPSQSIKLTGYSPIICDNLSEIDDSWSIRITTTPSTAVRTDLVRTCVRFGGTAVPFKDHSGRSGRLARFDVLFDSEENLLAFTNLVFGLSTPECREIFISSLSNIAAQSRFSPDSAALSNQEDNFLLLAPASFTLTISAASSCQDPLMHAKSLSAFCRNLDLDEPAIYHISNKEVKITLPLLQLQKLYPVLLEYNKEAKTPLFNSVFFYDLLTSSPRHISITPAPPPRHPRVPTQIARSTYSLSGLPTTLTDSAIRNHITSLLGYPLPANEFKWGTVGSFKRFLCVNLSESEYGTVRNQLPKGYS